MISLFQRRIYSSLFLMPGSKYCYSLTSVSERPHQRGHPPLLSVPRRKDGVTGANFLCNSKVFGLMDMLSIMLQNLSHGGRDV